MTSRKSTSASINDHFTGLCWHPDLPVSVLPSRITVSDVVRDGEDVLRRSLAPLSELECPLF